MRKFSIYACLPLVAAMVVGFVSTASAQIEPQLMKTLIETRDEAFLIKTLEQPGDGPEDISAKNLACKRLAVCGTDAAIPALVKLLPDPKQNFNARFALEAMPGDNVNKALRKAAVELKGLCAAGVIASIGNRRDAGGIATLKDLLGKKPDAVVKKAIFAALGLIANEDAANILLAESKGPKDANFTVWTGLADAMLDCAEGFERAGKTAKALELYDAVVVPSFPVFAQKAGAYHALLVRKGASAATVVEKLQSPKQCCFTGALKATREFAPADSETICKAIIAVLPKLEESRRNLTIRALADRSDAASRKLVVPVLCDPANSANAAGALAVMQAFKSAAKSDPGAFVAFTKTRAFLAQGSEIADAFAGAVIGNTSPEFDKLVVAAFGEAVKSKLFDATAENTTEGAKAILKMIEWRRIAATAGELAKLAVSSSLNPALRDGVCAALAEVVTLDNFDLLTKALAFEKDAQKADWYLRAACTRFPREECAAAVVKIYNAASTEDKIKLMGLLKQIGGKTALTCITDACWNDATVDEATKVLGEWNTPDDIEQVAAACLKVAKESSSNKYRVRGIRSYIRIPRQFLLPMDERIKMCATAFEAAARPEDKVLVFDIFDRQTEVAAIVAVLDYTKHAAFTERACRSAVTIGEKLNLAKPGWDWKTVAPDEEKRAENARLNAVKTLVATMETVKLTTKDAGVKARAQKVIDRWK